MFLLVFFVAVLPALVGFSGLRWPDFVLVIGFGAFALIKFPVELKTLESVEVGR